jgi:fused signal recognition particle receptor
VVDATTGGNALSQAREFHSALTLTGLVVTKLDGSGKGGIVVAIQDELGIPTRFVGTGENIDDFAPFDAREFLANIL